MTNTTLLRGIIPSLLVMLLASGCSSNKVNPIKKMHAPQIPAAQPFIFVDTNTIKQPNHYTTSLASHRPNTKRPNHQRSRSNIKQPNQYQLARYQHRSPTKKPPSLAKNRSRQYASISQRTPPSSNLQRQYRPTLKQSDYQRRNLVQKALQQIGVRYKYGGTTRKGFDCSGLMQHIYTQGSGIQIPRTAAAQRDKSKTIRYSELKPGDLIFFKTGKRTNHVGIYIGENKFVHASSGSKRVKIDSLNKNYWKRTFVKFGTYLHA